MHACESGRTKAWRGHFEDKSQVSKPSFPSTNSHNPWLATGRQLSVRNLTVRKSAMGNTSKMSGPDPTFFFSNAVSETMCLECFVFPSGELYQFLIGWNFFHFGVRRTGHTALENIENIAIDQNQQIIIIMNLASFRKLDFRRQNS